MKSERKRKTIAALVSLGIHVILIVVLAILTLTAAQRDPQDEDGIPVLFGDVPEAPDKGPAPPVTPVDEDGEEEQPASAPAEPAPSTPDPLITQEEEATIAAQKAKAEAERKKRAEAEARARAEAEAQARAKAEAERKAREEAERKAREEAARRRAAEEKARQEAAAAAANSRVSGAFGGGQGSPTGNANDGAPTGTGGMGSAQAKVGSRRVIYLPKPAYADQTTQGTIVVSIIVNAAGHVTSASVQSDGTASTALRNAALNAARQTTFSSSDNNAERGTITYSFKLR